MNETQTLLGDLTEQVSTTAKEFLESNWKCKAFKEELSLIKDPQLIVFAQEMISKLPDYFFHVAASSTGKYHPAYTNGDGGLLRHTKAAVRIAAELLRLEMYKSIAMSSDCIIIALILHDGWKHGQCDIDGSYPRYTLANHSEYCANWIKQEGIKLAPEVIVNLIADLVLTHMGQWNYDAKTGRYFAPKPCTQEECFVHLCDYLASRKCLEMDFSIPFEGWN